MLKLKTLLGTVIAICLIGLLSLIALVTLVDPSQFKNFIQNEITLKTQYPVKLLGPLYWQLDPNLSIVAHQIEIQSPKPSAVIETLKIKKARVEFRFWSLFTGKLWINTTLSGLDFQFEHDVHHKIGDLKIESLKGVWHYDKKNQKLRVKNFGSTFTLPNVPSTTLSGNFDVKQFGSDPILQGTFACSFAEYGNVTGTLKIQTEPHFTKILTATGTFRGEKLKIGSIPVTEMKTQMDFKEGLWTFDPLEAHIANSFHQGKLQIDLQNGMPKFSLSDKIESTDIHELLALFEPENPLKGKMVAKTSLLSQGNSLQDILHFLTGTAHITVTDGKLKGIELYPLLQHLQTTTSTVIDGLSRGQPVNMAIVVAAELEEWKRQAQQSQNLATSFRSLETEWIIQDERLLTKNFKLLHPDYTVDGHGAVDILHQQAEYQAHAWLNRPATHSSQLVERFFKETPLSIQIHGPLNNLTISPDLSHYTNDAIKLIEKDPVTSPDKAVNPLEKLFGFP